MPSIAILPPWHMFSNMSLNALGLPLISRPTSKPSSMPSSACTSASFSCATFTARVTPMRLAKLSRYSFTSVITTCRAPAWRAMAADIIPIGPAPVTNTSSPSTGKLSAECVALPNGSKIDATSRSISGLCTHTFVCGNAMYSANAPGRVTPMPAVSLHKCRRPAMQLRQCPHTTWPSPLTISPTRKSRTFSPVSTISPTNSCPTTIGVGTVLLAHSSHL